MVIPIGSVTLHAQPTLKEVIEDTAKKSEEVEIDVATMEGAPEDEFNRGVPRTTVQGFFLAVRERDFEKAAEYLDLRHLPEELKKFLEPNWLENSVSCWRGLSGLMSVN